MVTLVGSQKLECVSLLYARNVLHEEIQLNLDSLTL